MAKTLTSSSPSNNNVKFLCSYDGKIVLRRSDGRLRYSGGVTRVVSVPGNISFSDLMAKLGELCGYSDVKLRCQLPSEDLDVLVSIKSDEDLSNVIEEYSKASSIAGKELKIRAILSSPTSPSSSPPYSSATSSASSSADLPPARTDRCKPPSTAAIHKFPAKTAQFNAVPYFYNQNYYYAACRAQASSVRHAPSSSYFYNNPYYWH